MGELRSRMTPGSFTTFLADATLPFWLWKVNEWIGGASGLCFLDG